jgi:hypothetical protein
MSMRQGNRQPRRSGADAGIAAQVRGLPSATAESVGDGRQQLLARERGYDTVLPDHPAYGDAER